MSTGGTGAVILAAGKGTRMKSALPKVLQPILGEPLLFYVIEAVRAAGIRDVAVVVGHQGHLVEVWLEERYGSDVSVIWQEEQLGTGHAVQIARPWWSSFESFFVLCGDTPLIPSGLLRAFRNEMEQQGAVTGLVSFAAEDPRGYGRVLRSGGGQLFVVEEKDATPEQRLCREVNSGLYFFRSAALDEALESLTPENAQGEYYLPDVIGWSGEKGRVSSAFCWESEEDLMGINDPLQLARAGECLRKRILHAWMFEKGLKCVHEDSVWVGPRVSFDEDVTLEPQVSLMGRCHCGRGSRIGTGCVVTDSILGEACRLNPYVVLEESTLKNHVAMGPFAYVRGGALVENGAFVGKFVEIKKSHIGEGTKVPHLSYVGDATIGKKTNIGAGCITCNYDGRAKHPTTIGSGCFVGSDTMLVAPVTVHDNAVTGAGSVITADVPEGALGVARARQKNIEGWHEKMAKKEPKEEN